MPSFPSIRSALTVRHALLGSVVLAAAASVGALACLPDPVPVRASVDRYPFELRLAAFGGVLPEIRRLDEGALEVAWARPPELADVPVLKAGVWIWSFARGRGRWAVTNDFVDEAGRVRVRVRPADGERFASGRRYAFRVWARFADGGSLGTRTSEEYVKWTAP